MTSSDQYEDPAPGLPAQMRHIARHYVPAIIALVLLVGAILGGVERLRPDQHVSLVSFVVQTSSGASDADTQIRTLQSLMTSEVVANDLVRVTKVNLTPEQVLDRMLVERPPGGGVLSVSFYDANADRSRTLAEQMIPVFLSRVTELSQPQPGQLAVNYSVRTWGAGAVTTGVESPPVLLAALVGLVLGALLALLLLALRARRHPVLLSPEQAVEAYRLPLLGALSGEGRSVLELRAATAALVGNAAPDVWPAEVCSVLVLRPGRLSNGSDVLVALSTTFSPQRESVVVDATGGGPGSLTQLERAGERAGLTNVLAGVPVDPVLLRFGTEKESTTTGTRPAMWLLAAGVTDPDRRPSVDGERLAALVVELSSTFGVVVDAVSDSGNVTAWQTVVDSVDAVLVLAEQGVTTMREAQDVGDALLTLTDRPAAVLVLGHDRLLGGAARKQAADGAAAVSAQEVRRLDGDVLEEATP